MKKHMMALALCLVLTTTSAMAANTTKIAPKKAPAKVVTPVANKVEAPALTPEQTARQKFEAKIAQDRQDLYCKLGLSAEQKAKAEDLHKVSREKAEPLMAKLHEEKVKLRDLKAKKACPCKIAEQKAKVHAAKKSLKANREAYMKDFEALLSKEQLAKLKEIKEEKKAECKKCHPQHHHHEHFKHGEGEMHHPYVGAPQESAPKCPCEAK